MKTNPINKKHLNLGRWENTADKVITPFEEFLHSQKTSGILLVLMTVVALALANSSYAEAFAHLLHLKVGFAFEGVTASLTIHHIINDGLMALFFFLVGLEIKREFLNGELSDIKNATLPIFGAIGGMALPAGLYYWINAGLPGEMGWGIPMATDIAFALAAVMLLGTRVPKSLITFLVALAIVDDLGAVAVIAIFYTEQVYMAPLLSAGVMFLLLIGLNQAGVHKPLPYFVIGIAMWFFMLASGVHATVAGVLTALTIPAIPKFNPRYFAPRIEDLVLKYKDNEKEHLDKEKHFRMSEEQKAAVSSIECATHKVQAPLNRLEHQLHLPVGLFIIPLFALANAGIAIDISTIDVMLMEPVSLGIISGLLLGKAIGIFGAGYIAIKSGMAKLPEGANYLQLLGVSILGGIGFTMSIFIAELAFKGQADLLLQAKTSIMFASLMAVAIGLGLLIIKRK